MKATLPAKGRFNIAILGATGLVGRAMLRTLERRDFPAANIRLLASEKSEGREIGYRNCKLRVEKASPDSFNDIDIALFSAGADASRTYAPEAVKRGAIVVDNSSAFRMSDNVPLVVPEANPEALDNPKSGIIANPNCSTIQLVVTLKPLMELGIEHIFVSTYQAVSGMGQKGIDRLLEETGGFAPQEMSATYAERDLPPGNVPYAYNAVPKCDAFLDNGYTREEMKVLNESRKILGNPELKVTVTAVRVPVLYGHSESVSVKFRNNINSDTVRDILERSPGITVVDDPSNEIFPHPLSAEGSEKVLVGRIRQDLSDPSIVSMFVVSDNILKGAAWNAIQIAELLTNPPAGRIQV